VYSRDTGRGKSRGGGGEARRTDSSSSCRVSPSDSNLPRGAAAEVGEARARGRRVGRWDMRGYLYSASVKRKV